MATRDEPEKKMAGSLKARESRLRRAAARRGMALAKSRRGGASNGYRIVDPQTDAIVHDGDAGEYSLTLDQAEAFLGDPQQTGSISIDNLNAANDE